MLSVTRDGGRRKVPTLCGGVLTLEAIWRESRLARLGVIQTKVARVTIVGRDSEVPISVGIFSPVTNYRLIAIAIGSIQAFFSVCILVPEKNINVNRNWQCASELVTRATFVRVAPNLASRDPRQIDYSLFSARLASQCAGC